MIKIRKAKNDDFESIQQLNYLLFEREQINYDPTLNVGWPLSQEGEEYFRKSINNEDSLTLVAIDNRKDNTNNQTDKIIGYLIGSLKDIDNFRKINRQAVLDNMYVDKKYRNKKIGSRLVKEFIKWAKGKKAENIRVTAFASNTEAVNFYRRNGFKNYNNIMEILL